MRYPIHFGGIGGVSFMHYSIGKFVDVLMLCQIDHLWMNVLYEGDQMVRTKLNDDIEYNMKCLAMLILVDN